MIIFMLVVAILAVIVLTIHVTLEINALEKSVNGMIDRVKKRYESKRSAEAGQ